MSIFIKTSCLKSFYLASTALELQLLCASFQLVDRLLILSQIDEISPFLPDVDCSLLAINMPDLRLIKRDLVKPMRSSDNPVEYVPTQFIADLVKGMGFDGIGYSSVMATSKQGSGYNIAFFGSSKELFRTNEITRYSIRGIEYTIEQMGRMC